MLVDTGSDKLSLVECPACGADLRDKDQPWHIGTHSPADFGLTPLRDAPVERDGDGLFVVVPERKSYTTVHSDGDCWGVRQAAAVVPATAATLGGDERRCGRCFDVGVDG
jgi:hypothetical protein